MEFLLSRCAPYLSMTLFHVDDIGIVSARSIGAEIRKELKKKSPRLKRKFNQVKLDIDVDPEVEVWALGYLEQRAPPWHKDPGQHDRNNHLVVVVKRGDAVGMTFSSQTARNAVVRSSRKLNQAEFSNIRPYSASDMEKAFVENQQVRTLWLNSTHGQTPIKPDSKVLAGLELESALDPLEDQAYYFSSLRSTSQNCALSPNEDRHAIIGVRPTRAQVWIGPTASWSDYLRRSTAVLDHAQERLERTKGEPSIVPVLARPTTNLEGIEGVYGIALIVPEGMDFGRPARGRRRALAAAISRRGAVYRF